MEVDGEEKKEKTFDIFGDEEEVAAYG